MSTALCGECATPRLPEAHQACARCGRPIHDVDRVSVIERARLDYTGDGTAAIDGLLADDAGIEFICCLDVERIVRELRIDQRDRLR